MSTLAILRLSKAQPSVLRNSCSTPDADFFVRCDASLYGVRCVLKQHEEEGNSSPIAFFS